MREILLLLLTTGLSMMLTVTMGILYFRSRRRVWAAIGALALILGMAVGGLAIYRFMAMSYDKVSNAIKPRSGQEAYDALFGKRLTDCVQVRAFRDQIVPKIDTDIILHITTCPAEVRRILTTRAYTFQKLPMPHPAFHESEFRLDLPGDSVLIFNYLSEDSRNQQTLWVTTDSTQLICQDIFD